MNCNCNSGFMAFGNSWWWIIILILIVLFCGNGFGCGCPFNNGCDRDCGNNCGCC